MKLVQILALAQERIRSGQLPARLPATIWAGRGEGHRCAVCDEVISSAERQYGFAVVTAGGPIDYRLHFPVTRPGSAVTVCSKVGRARRPPDL